MRRILGIAGSLAVLSAPASGAAAAAASASQSVVSAQPEPEPEPQPDRRPEAARRTVGLFDFEEFSTNPGLVPLRWRVAQDGLGQDRPGFPIFNAPELDYGVAFAGQGSVRLPTRGGSTSLIVEPGVLPVFPEADYRVSTMVRTHGLEHARAFIEASLLDDRGGVIPGSRVRSLPMQTDGQWEEVGVTVRGDFPEAAFVRIELSLLQPEQFARDAPGYGRAWASDVSGAAWFDDVSVVQQPRVSLSTGAPGNVVNLPSKPVITILARDAAGETLEGVCRVFDADGRLVRSMRRPMQSGRWEERWDPALTRLGWYRVVVEIWGDGRRLGWGTLDLAWLPARRARGEAPGGFGVLVSDPALGTPREIAGAGEVASVDHLTLPIWPASLEPEAIGALAQGLGELTASTGTLRGHVEFALTTVPDTLASVLGIRREQVMRALAQDRTTWSAYLDPLLDRFGQSVRRWQLGAAGDESATGSAAFEDNLRAAGGAIARLVPGPVLVVPWRADREPAALPSVRGIDHEFNVLVPASFAPEGVEEAVREWTPPASASSPTPTTFVLETIDPDIYGSRAAVIDAFRRGVHAWAGAGASQPRLSLVDPWVRSDDPRATLMPRPQLAAWRTLRDHLGGRQVLGTAPTSPGVRCFVLSPRDRSTEAGALVAWSEWADPESAAIDMMLSTGPVRVIDPFGNERVVHPEEQIRRGLIARRHRIPLTDMPVIVEGVDVALVRLQSSLRVDPPTITAQAAPLDLSLILRNPWDLPLAGRALIVDPGGTGAGGQRDRSWRIEPRTFDFEAPAGGEATMPLSVLMREFEEAGTKNWIIDVRLAGREDLGWITIAAPMEVGLDGVDLRLSTRPNGADLWVELSISNSRDTPVVLDSVVFAPGFPRERRTIGQVAPRSQLARRFFYADGARLLSGQAITASIRETDNGRRENRTVIVP
ncbi:MAG: hypothetical protein H6809_01385 [Phycisphaeraceae bacterium]|nr:hypothetical protein [Phycisphaeraceae bacterium]